MTLADFLATANADDTLALAEAKAYTESVYVDIPNQYVEQQFSVYGVIDAVENNQTNVNSVTIDAGKNTTVGQVCKYLLRKLSSNGTFSINPNEKEGQRHRTIIQRLRQGGLVDQAFLDDMLALGTSTINPFASATIEQVKAIRHPASWTAVTIASGNDKVVLPEGDAIISISNTGGFRFTVTPAEAFNGTVQVRIKAKKANESTFTLQTQFPINIAVNSADAIAQTFKRVAALQGYRHFIFEYLPPYAGAVTDVVVEGIV